MVMTNRSMDSSISDDSLKVHAMPLTNRPRRRRRHPSCAFSSWSTMAWMALLTMGVEKVQMESNTAAAFQATTTLSSSTFCGRRQWRKAPSPMGTSFKIRRTQQHLMMVALPHHGKKQQQKQEGGSEQEPSSSSSFGPPPLFDLDSVPDGSTSTLSSSSSSFQVPDSNHKNRRQQQQQFYPVGGMWDDDDEHDEGQEGFTPQTTTGEADTDTTTVLPAIQEMAADGLAWDTYARDEDDILTEREDRLYVDEAGRSRKVETCILVGVEDLSAKRRQNRPGSGRSSTLGTPEEMEVYFTLEESMKEMRELIKTAGMELVGEITQRLGEPNPKTYVGTGKVKEAEDLLNIKKCCTVVFDAELTPGQQKALENAFNKKAIQNDFMGSEQEGEIKVIDRTALILDIFAQHAKTREGKLQVDLALHEYRKPRLTRMWTHLERQSGAGGVGLRGPGESQLEIDKRLVRDRIITLKEKIDDVQKQRDLHRKGRSNSGLPILSLVGYTNAGKSTLLNFLTRAGVMAENILFATLDPTTRKVKLPGYKTHPEVLLTDTVGFIQKLPTHLVAAFRATLEEVREADVLIHVVDVSNSAWEKQERAVRSVLSEIGAGDKPVVRVLNKIDLLDSDDAEYLKYEAAMTPHSVAVSSLTGEGMQDFVAVVEDALSELLVPIEVEIPYSKGDELNLIHEVGNVETIDYRPTGTYVAGRVPQAVANRLKEYNIHGADEELKKAKTPEGDDDADDIDWVAIGRGRHTAKNV